ncbi:GNAT family N-acetyltransferase [Hoylesella oralis]|uniref:GNAT family N-acetyltransferase n=1 Tax=Hoylesella oralis TaxID=28134 RepID=UPI0036088E0B
MTPSNQKASQVILRAIEPEDLDTLYMIENNIELWNVGTTNVPYSRYMLHDYIANAAGDIYTDKQVRFMIENSQKETVGIVDIVDFNPRHQRAEVGIVIQNRYRGLGYAKHALVKIVDYALKVLHLHQLYAIVEMENTDSVNLFSQLGFEQNTMLKDWLYDGHEYHDAIVMQLFL